MEDGERKLREARKTLLEDYPFFGYNSLRLKIEAGKLFPVTWTDGKVLGYNPDGLKKLTRQEAIFLAAHETLHVCSGHCLPHNRQGKDLDLYNQAGDYWINAQLKKANIGVMPEGGLYDPKYDDHKTWDTERIYRDLKEKEQKSGKKTPKCVWCKIEDTKNPDGSNLSKAEEEAEQVEIDQSNIEAEKLAISCGKGTGTEEVIVNKTKNPPVDCWERLRRFVSKSVTPNGLTWSKPNKRYMMEDLYLPGQLKEGLGTVVLCIDTSGSITQDQLDSDAAHTKHILSQYHPQEIIVIYCDDEIKKTEFYGPYDDFVLKAHGRGGTDFNPPFDWLKENNIKPDCLIYFTDLEGPSPQEDPGYPTLWGWHKSSYGSYATKPVFGEVVEIM